MVKIYLPPPNREIDPQYHVIPAGTVLKRIFNPASHNASASSFRYNGPRGRFDHQPRVNGKPVDNLNRGIIYAAYTLSCCLVEIFGDEDLITIEQHQLAIIKLNQSLKLLDLRGQGAWNAGLNTTQSLSTQSPCGTLARTRRASSDRRKITQEWGKHFYDYPEDYGNIEGIVFSSAKNSEDALALYERAENKIASVKISTQSLKDSAIRKEIFLTAKKLHLPIQFY